MKGLRKYPKVICVLSTGVAHTFLVDDPFPKAITTYDNYLFYKNES